MITPHKPKTPPGDGGAGAAIGLAAAISGGQPQFITSVSPGQAKLPIAIDPTTIWQAIAREISRGRPALARQHNLFFAAARFEAGALIVSCNPSAAEWMTYFGSAPTKPLAAAAALAGWAGLIVRFEAEGGEDE